MSKALHLKRNTISWTAFYLALGGALGLLLGLFLAAPAQASHCPFQLIEGTSGEDYLIATDDRTNTIRGFDGADFIRGKDCNDELRGGKAADNIHGAFGNDDIYGFDGPDNPNNCNILFTYCGELVGGGGSDVLDGGTHADLIDDTASSDLDIAFGEGGDDTIRVNDGDTSDTADGGAGTDQCVVDVASERTSTCE